MIEIRAIGADLMVHDGAWRAIACASEAEAAQRAAVIREARSWLGCLYRHKGRVKAGPNEKGAVDCATLLAEVYHRAGVVPFVALEDYSPQWFLHANEEKYLSYVLPRAREVSEPKPGDVALCKFGRSFAHGAIIVDPGWPAIIHAFKASGQVTLDRGDGGRLGDKPPRFFSAWA
jgi:cell wall-associated NlpC family hydrolase